MPDDGRFSAAEPGARLIRQYEAIAQVSHAMLAAARADDWVRVSDLEDECRVLIEGLKRAAQTQSLGLAEQRRRIQLLREILADDAEIRARSEPWLRQLETLCQSSRRTGAGSD